MLGMRKLLTRLPAKDLERARAWYSEKLGLEPAEERPGGLRYVVGACEFALYTSAGQPDGSFTQMGFEVEDLAETVAELKRRGVVFEEYDAGLPPHRRRHRHDPRQLPEQGHRRVRCLVPRQRRQHAGAGAAALSFGD